MFPCTHADQQMVTLPCKHVACRQCLQTWATKADLVRNTPAHVLENRHEK